MHRIESQDRNDCPGDSVGGKARTLRELEAAGFRVPPFVCSPADCNVAFRDLGSPLAVRSSASVEDGQDLSFAGQFKSVLHVQTAEQLRRAIRECQDSVRETGVVEYCRQHGVDPNSLRMDVIVQRMIRPELAGVAFTVNPSTGAEEVIIEACEGLADELLLGRKAPISPNHALLRRHGPEIRAVAQRIQRHFGAPQDIEFAIEKGILYILQARPITQICFAPGVGVWTNADFRDGGVSSTVCTPLMWSLYDFIWEDTLKGFLREIKLLDGDFQAGRLFFGRPYWNLGAVKSCLAKLPGFNERKFDDDLSVRTTYEGDGLCTPMTLRGILQALPTAFAVRAIWKRQEILARQFLASGFEALLREHDQVTNPSDDQFEQLIRQAYRTTESNYFRTIYCTSLAKLDFTDSFPGADYPALVAGLPDLRHFEPAQALSEMRARGVTDFAPFLERFRHHSRRELDIRAPRWDEDEPWVKTLWERSPTTPRRDARADYEKALRTALSQLPWHRRRSFVRKLNRLRTFLWLREEMRDLSSRMYYRIRRHVMAIAQRRGWGDDIFFMTIEEILHGDRSQVDDRRATYESFRNFKAPHEITSGARTITPPSPHALCGIAASRGTARGLARVVHAVEQAAHVEEGAILVCPFTDPGWTPILSRVSGVITETGGLLSHAAIICREYGIPALLSVPEATTRIRDRSQIVLRADQGCVEVIASGTQTGPEWAPSSDLPIDPNTQRSPQHPAQENQP